MIEYDEDDLPVDQGSWWGEAVTKLVRLRQQCDSYKHNKLDGAYLKRARARGRKYYQEHKEELRKRDRDAYHANLEESRKKARERQAAYRARKKLAALANVSHATVQGHDSSGTGVARPRARVGDISGGLSSQLSDVFSGCAERAGLRDNRQNSC